MEQNTKKIILVSIAAAAGVVLLAGVVWYVFFISQFARYQDKTHGFSIKYPKAWQTVIAPQPGAAVVFVSPKETALDVFQENVNIAVEPLPEGIATVKEFTDRVELQMSKVFNNIKVQQKKPLAFGNRSGYRIIFSVEQPQSMKILNVVAVKGAERAYVLTYMAMSKRYEAYLPLVEEMVKSFQLK